MEIVRCPKCRKRLFDKSENLAGTVIAHYRRCKTTVSFTFPSPPQKIPEPKAGT